MRSEHDCQTYLDHLRIEHLHLNEMLLAISRMLTPGHQVRTREQINDIVSRLELLRSELGSHFREEEEGGCMEEAISRCPGVSSDADAVIREHPSLREQLEKIIALIGPRDGLDPVPWDAVATEFGSFSRRLRIHELAENRILRHGLGGEGTDIEIDE